MSVVLLSIVKQPSSSFFHLYSNQARLIRRPGNPRYTEHQTVLSEPNGVSDRCRALDWVSEAPFGVITGICRTACMN